MPLLGNVINYSVFTYAKTCPVGVSFVTTGSGVTDNPLNSGSFLHLVWRRSTGRTILSMGIDSSYMYKTYSNDEGVSFSAWKKCTFS